MSNLRPKLTIKNLPVAERPRERLIHYGPDKLSVVELMAIILRTGARRRSVLALAEELIITFQDLRGLAKASWEELAQIPGVGPAKAIQLKAAFELGRRVLTGTPASLPVIRKPQDVFELLRAGFQDLDREYFKVVHLNIKNQVLKIETTAIGLLSSAPVHPREVFKVAVKTNSASLILAHNHPSGDPRPSRDDLALTGRLREAGDIIGIAIVDHVIFGDNCFLSLKEQGQL
jgi:DNA repair protein RadC